MIRTLRLTLSALFIFTAASAQYNTNQNKIWAFGRQAGLDFNSGSPVAFTTSINTFEASASVSSSTGSLLFYTDGKVVYNRTGAVMPSGASIVPYATISSREGALIAPVIGTTNKYYVFSIQQMEEPDPLKAKLSYSIVDMALAGGMGDVVTSSMGVLMADSMSEVVISVLGNSNDVWVVSHSQTSDFVTFRITSSGIGTAIESHLDTVVRHGWGFLRANHQRTKIVEATSYSVVGSIAYGGMCLFDFNATTGVVSNPVVFDTTIGSTIGAEFSPDGTKLYVPVSGVGVVQYDLSAPTPAAIYASKYVVVPNISAFGYPRLAPNGKIYFRNVMNDCMSCISSPNSAGAACGYTLNAVNLSSGTGSYMDLPNVYVGPPPATADVAEITLSDITIAPNPANSYVSLSAPMKITSVSISNMLGQVMYDNKFDAENIEVDVAKLAPGMYCLKINGSLVQKFVKE